VGQALDGFRLLGSQFPDSQQSRHAATS